MYKFYIGATPIGGNDDITRRTLDIIEKADVIVCELLFMVKRTIEFGNWKTKPDVQYLEYCVDYYGNQTGKRVANRPITDVIVPGIHETILELIKQNKTMIYLPERGSIGIEDPGFGLMEFLENNGVQVVVLPGVSSVMASYVVARPNGGARNSNAPYMTGNNSAFTFQPLIDLDKNGIEKFIKSYRKSPNVLIFLVHDEYMLYTFETMRKYYGDDRNIMLCMDVSLPTEQIVRTNLKNIVENFDEKTYLMRFTTIVVDGVYSELPDQD